MISVQPSLLSDGFYARIKIRAGESLGGAPGNEQKSAAPAAKSADKRDFANGCG